MIQQAVLHCLKFRLDDVFEFLLKEIVLNYFLSYFIILIYYYMPPSYLCSWDFVNMSWLFLFVI
jgi:hypothetical protein